MKKNKIKFPSRKEIEHALKVIEQNERAGNSSEAIPADATPIEQLKYVICEQIIRFKRRGGYSTQELAEILESPAPRISEMLYKKISLFSLDYLMGIIVKLSKHDKSIKKKVDDTLKIMRT